MTKLPALNPKYARCYALVGEFFCHWAIMESNLDTLISRALKLTFSDERNMLAHCMFFPEAGKGGKFVVEFMRVSAKGKFAFLNTTWSQKDFDLRQHRITTLTNELKKISGLINPAPILNALSEFGHQTHQPMGGLYGLGIAHLQSNPTPSGPGLPLLASTLLGAPQKKQSTPKKK